MNGERNRCHFSLVQHRCSWVSPSWLLWFDATQPENGFHVVCDGGSRDVRSSGFDDAVLFRLLRRRTGELAAGFVLEDLFATAEERCVARYRDARGEGLSLTLSATAAFHAFPFSEYDWSHGKPGEMIVLDAVLLLRSEQGELRPGIILANEVVTCPREILGEICVSFDELRRSPIPFISGMKSPEVKNGQYVLSVEGWQLTEMHWLVCYVHPLDGTPTETTELLKEFGSAVSQQGEKKPQDALTMWGYTIFPEGIEKGVTFAARAISILFSGTVPREAVLSRLEQFFVSQPSLSEA